MVLSSIGHLPQEMRLPSFGYTPSLMRLAMATLKYYQSKGVTRVQTGPQQGWSFAVTYAALQLNIPVSLVLAHLDEQDAFSLDALHLHLMATLDVLEAGGDVMVRDNRPYQSSMLYQRDQWLVNHCDQLIALHNPTSTRLWTSTRVVTYAARKGKRVHHLWSSWEKYRTKPIRPVAQMAHTGVTPYIHPLPVTQHVPYVVTTLPLPLALPPVSAFAVQLEAWKC